MSNRFGDDDGLGPRRGDNKAHAQHAATLARTLMGLKPQVLDALEIDDDLKDDVRDATRITAHVARRREERRLAGSLRGEDLDAIETALATVTTNRAPASDARAFKRAEHWRAVLLDEGVKGIDAVLAEAPALDAKTLTPLIKRAQKEAQFGSPKGAKKQLFRALIAALGD